MRRLLRYVWLLPGVVIASVLLLELLLQAAALLVQENTRHVEARWLTGHSRILAVGDSNTYGLYLEARDSWPMQLEQQWNVAQTANPVEVLNLGYPGTNSFRVRDNLPDLLDKLAPDLVLIMVGFNDFWTPLEQVKPDVWQSPLVWLKVHSRICRAYVMWQRERIVQDDITFGSPRPSEKIDVQKFMDPTNIDKHLLRMGGESFYLGTLQGEPAKNMKALEENLTAMVAAARMRGADVVFLTYPSNWGFYPNASKWIRSAAQRNTVDLIDITPSFIALCKDGPKSCPEYLFEDGHATAKGNALVAEKVRDYLKSYFPVQ